jgi:hypothetical protein
MTNGVHDATTTTLHRDGGAAQRKVGIFFFRSLFLLVLTYL